MSPCSRPIAYIVAIATVLVAAGFWLINDRNNPTVLPSQKHVGIANPTSKQNRIPGPNTPAEILATAQAKPCDKTVLTYLDLSRPPTQAELIAAGNLGEPLTPTHAADPSSLEDSAARALQQQDNLQFGTAIQAWNQHRYPEAFALFEQHSNNSPGSPWVAESRLHLGCYCQYNRRLAEAAGWFDAILSSVAPYYGAGNNAYSYHRDPIQLFRLPGQNAFPTSGATTSYKVSVIGGVKGKITDTTAQGSSIGGYLNRKTYSSSRHQVTSFEGADGKKSSYIHHSNGTLQTLILPKANTTPSAPPTDPYKIHYTYEPNGIDLNTVTRYLDGTLKTLADHDYWPGTRNLKQTTNALGQIIGYTWHPNGLPSSITDQTTGDILTFIYDQGPDDADSYPTWQLLKLKRNGNTAIETAYDPIGRPQIILDLSGNYSQPIFDNLNRLTRTDYSDSTYTEQLWECCHIGETRSGKVVNGQDRLLARTKIVHDGRGLPIRSIDTAGKITKIGYDDAGRMTTLTDPRNQVTTWQFDLIGRLEKKIYPDTTFERIDWLNMAQPERFRSRRGQLSYPSFDAHGNLTTFNGPAFYYTRTCDPWDRLKTLTDNNTSNVHTYDYDDLNRPTSLDGPWPDDTLAWQYLDAQRQIIRTHPGSLTETTTGDAFGRINAIENPLGVFTPGYDPQERVNTWKREAPLANPSGATRSFAWISQYDFNSQLTSIAEKSLAGNLQTTWDYGHDLAGNITTVQTSIAASTSASLTKRTHNTLNQIATIGGGGSTIIRGNLSEAGQVSVGITGSGEKPARRLEGNRFETELPLQEGANSLTIAASDYSTNRSNYQFTINVAAQSPAIPTYDNDGNLLSDGNRNYEWDALSRLTKITWTAGTTTQFKYNALSQRSERIDTYGGTVIKSYDIYDGIHLLGRRTGTSASTATADRRYYDQGEYRKNGITWDKYIYCRDHLGSIREVVKSNGSNHTLAVRYDYDPYGKRLIQYQASGYTCDFGYTGHITTPSLVVGQTELVLTHYRAYDPELNRWLSADPIGEAGGINLYAYVLGDPINGWDPSGLDVCYLIDDGNKAAMWQSHAASLIGNNTSGWAFLSFSPGGTDYLRYPTFADAQKAQTGKYDRILSFW